MRYLCLIYGDEALWQRRSQDDANAMHADYGVFTTSIRNSGHMIGGDALQPTATATTVRVRNGEIVTTDGPFAETKEQLGGFYLVEAKDRDEAIQLAARIPGARLGSVEVRPIAPMN